MSGDKKFSCCVIVPAFNEADRIGPVLAGVRLHGIDLVVVDDGSTDRTAEIARDQGAVVLRHEVNRGKGASLMTAFRYTRDKKYDVVITIDADGQHDPAAIPKFLAAYGRSKIPVLIGNRMWDLKKIPAVRRWTNRAMSSLLSRIMRAYLPDTQCGYRLFRADILPFVPVESPRFAMESEILLHLASRGFRMDSVRIPVVYSGQASRIRPFSDGARFLSMLLRHRFKNRVRH